MSEQSGGPMEEGARLGRVLDEYLAEVARGNSPDKEALLARYPELASDLEACLSALEFISGAADASSPVVGPATTGAEEAGTLGDFRLVREIGRGGMGVVY